MSKIRKEYMVTEWYPHGDRDEQIRFFDTKKETKAYVKKINNYYTRYTVVVRKVSDWSDVEL